MGEKSVSAQALVDAKNEVLALQQIVHQKDMELSSLHDTVRQRDDDTQQLVARLDAATRDYAAVHEESRQLRDKVRQFEESLASERAEYNAMLNELRGESAVVERESARLALERLHKENEELRRREVENTEVVGRLMADVEAGHRGVAHLPKPAAATVTYTKEEHDADVERQLVALRAELEEMFGEDIKSMKEQMRDHYSTTVEQLRRDLARSDEERSRFAGQVSLWQQQYMALSQQGVSSVDISQQLNDAVADNVKQRQHVAELTAQVELLNTRLSQSLLPRSYPEASGPEMSSELEECKREIAEEVDAECRSLRDKVDELHSMLKDASEDRDRSVALCQTIEQELETVRLELMSTRSQHAGELQQIESKAASDVSQLISQLASAKEQLETLKVAVVEANKARDETKKARHEKQLQFEAARKDWDQHIERLKVENADALQHLASDYTKCLEAERAKMSAVIDEYGSREQNSLTLIEELQMKYEIVKKENHAISEQLQQQSGVQTTLNADVLTTPSAGVWGASDVDSVVARLSSQLEKVTRERDSAMQSLQVVYGDRIELQQTIKTLESERSALNTRVNHLDSERQSLGDELVQTRGELSRLRYSAIGRSAAGFSSVGTGSIPNMPSVTDESDRHGPDVIDSLRAEFEEMQRLRRERDRSSSCSTIVPASSTMSVSSHTQVNVNMNMKSADVTRTDADAAQNSSEAEVEELLRAEDVATMKQDYAALCAELVRLHELLANLQRVDREREQVRSQFELEIRLLRDEMLRRDCAEAADVTGTVEAALDDELKEREAEIDSLKGRLATTLSRMEELIAEKDEQCASYEQELEEVREEHSSALKRIDALVQEHNILIGGQVPLSSVSPENVREMPIVIHSEILESVDEDVSPKRLAYESQAKEIEHLREQLHRAAQDMETLSLDRHRLNEALESNTAELLAGLEKAAAENTEQQQMYERKLATYSQDFEQLSRKLDTVSAELEQAKSAHSSELAKMRDEYQLQFNELSFSNDESNREQHQELVAARKQCAEMQKQLEQIAAEKVSMEQEYVTVLQDINKENSARISALRKGFDQDLAQAQMESEKVYSDHTVQLEEELNQSRQEMAQLKQCLEVYEGSDKHQSETGDIKELQVLQLRINDLTETKDELQRRLYVASAENERLVSEVETLQTERENFRSHIATLPQDGLHGFSSIDAESFADTSGDSHVFYTPSKNKKTVVEKLKSLQAEKELLTNMVDRLNAEKEQLKAYLITGNVPSHVFEADICHLELSAPDRAEVSQVGNSAELRLIALESEKELLAGMLEKLSSENEQLISLMMAANDNVLDVSYDDGLSDINNVEKSVDVSEEPELTTDEVVALRYEHAVLRAKVSELERQISSASAHTITDGKENEEKTRNMEMVHSSIQTDIHQLDDGISMTSDQASTTSDIEHLHRTVRQMTHERDVAYSEMLAIKERVCTIMDHSVPADDSQREKSTESILAALDVFIHQAVEHERAASQETVSELQSQIAELRCTSETALTEVREILSEIDPDSAVENQYVDVTDSESDALLIAVRMLKENTASSGTGTASQQALLLENVTEERDKLYKELENARRQLVEVLPYRETVSVDNEQTIGSLIDQINHLVQQKNELEERPAKKAVNTSDDGSVAVNYLRAGAEATSEDQRLSLVDSSVQVDLPTVHIPEHPEVDSVQLEQTLERPIGLCVVEDDMRAFGSSERDQPSMDPSLPAEAVESWHSLAENVRTLEERLSTVAAERDQLAADLGHVVQECVELKASRVDSTETTKHFEEALRSELDTVKSDRELLAERQAAADRHLTEMKAERDELTGKIGALQDALKLALEERDRYIQSSAGTDAQLSGITSSITVPVETDHRSSEMQKSDEASPLASDLVENNRWLQNRVEELEVVRASLLEEKEAVAELYGKTVDELKARLVEMQATVDSLQSEISVKVQDNEAVVSDLQSRLLAAELRSSCVDEESRQQMIDLANMQSTCEEKQKVIDELTSRLQSVTVTKSDNDDENTTPAKEPQVSGLPVEETADYAEMWPAETRKLANELHTVSVERSSLSVELESAKCDLDAWKRSCEEKTSCIEELQNELQLLRHAKPQTGELGTMTEDVVVSGTNLDDDMTVETAHLDEDVSTLHTKLQMLTAQLAAVTAERDEFATRLSESEHSSLRHAKPQTGEQCTMTEDVTVSGTDIDADVTVETVPLDEDVSALHTKLQTLMAELAAVTAERDEIAARHSESEHSSLRHAKPQMGEQCTMTEGGAVLGIDVDNDVTVETAHLDDDLSALHAKLQTLTSELAAATTERDEFAAKLSELEHSSGKSDVDGFVQDADLALVETGHGTAAVTESTKFADEGDGLLVSEERLEGKHIETSEATDHKELYLHLQSRQSIAVTDSSVNVKNITEELAAETDDAAVQTDVSLEQNAGDDLQVKIDELLTETCALKEERDEILQKLLLAENCIQETQDSANAQIKAFKDEMASAHEELSHFETLYMTLETEQQKAVETWQAKAQKLCDEFHAVSVERGSLSTELESAKCDLDALKRSCEEKTKCVEELRNELVASERTQQALNDEISTCKIRLEERARNESKLTEKCRELEAALNAIRQEKDAVIEENISSLTELVELKQTTSSWKSEIEDLRVQLAALKDENTALTTNCNVATDRYTDLKNTHAETETKLQSQVKDLEEQIRSLSGELENTSLDLLTAERKYEELRQSLAGTAADAASKLETLTLELSSATKEKSELVQKLADVEKTCEELKSKLESTSEERNRLVIQLHEAESERVELKKSAAHHLEALVNVESLEKECSSLREEMKCLSERYSASELARNNVESELDDQQQRILTLQTDNHELTQTRESLLSENGCLKQQISEYIEKVNTCASNEQLALENWTRMEEQLLTRIKGLEADLSAMEDENGNLKSEVDRIPELSEEVASIAVERDDAHKRCKELEAEVVNLRKNVEDVSHQFEVTNTELSESATELSLRCQEAECEVDRLKKLVDEKTGCVLDLQSALSRTQEELSESQKERKSLLNALAAEKNATKEQTAANETAMSEVKSLAEVDRSNSEQLVKELALKCEQLKDSEDRLLLQQEHVRENIDGKVAADIESLQSECDDLRTLIGTCQLDANDAREKLSAMEGICQGLTAERDELAKERCTLHAENDELSRKLSSLQQRLERTESDGAVHGTEAVEKHVIVEKLDAAQHDELAAGDDIVVQEELNLDVGDAASQHLIEMNAKVSAVDSELETALETIHQLQEDVRVLQVENERLRQQKQAAEDNLKAVLLDLAASGSESVDRLQLELAGVGSNRSTEGSDNLEARLQELDASDSTVSLSSVHASRTYTKLVSSDAVASDIAAEEGTLLTYDICVPPGAEVKMPPGDPSENEAGSSTVRASRTYTKLGPTDTRAWQTVNKMMVGKSEIVNDLYSQINRLQLELDEQKLSQCQLIEKLKADCIELAETCDVLRQENSCLNERLNEKSSRASTGSMTDQETIQSQVRAEIEAETKQRYQSELEALETEYQEKLAAVKDECNRQVEAAENCARAKILECSPAETFAVESSSSTDGDSTAQLSDAIRQRDQLRSDLADKIKELSELREEIGRLREDSEKQKTSLSPAVTGDVEPCGDDGLDLDEDQQRVVANLESQLLMSTEENERLQQKINELENKTRQQIVDEVNAVRKQMEDQHVTEIKVLEFRLQESYEQRLSRSRTEVEAELEEAYQKRKQTLDARFKKRAEDFRQETEHKFLQELRKVREVIKYS